jgi:hypothetical protein
MSSSNARRRGKSKLRQLIAPIGRLASDVIAAIGRGLRPQPVLVPIRIPVRGRYRRG